MIEFHLENALEWAWRIRRDPPRIRCSDAKQLLTRSEGDGTCGNGIASGICGTVDMSIQIMINQWQDQAVCDRGWYLRYLV